MKTREMTRKITMAALLLLLNVAGMHAQSLDGTWKAGEVFQKLLEAEMENDPDIPNMELTVSFDGKKFTPKLRLQKADEEMNLDMEVWVEGACSRRGQKVDTTVDGSKCQIKILALETEDEEMKEMLKTEATRTMLYHLVEQMVKESDALNDLASVWTLFKTFEVKSLTADKLIVTIEDYDIDFDKVSASKR